ncbi:MAG TPA: CARDB domain-containing protein, partial [Pirellulaceae bacterium]|nr:CARDB domain-containing protein [Pirellulaceae bacterium]
VSNEGIGATNSTEWSDQVWLASDQQGSQRIDLGSFSHGGALAVHEAYVRNAQVTLPSTLAAGRYYLFVTTGGPFEFLATTNNTNLFGPIDVTYVAPPTFDLELLEVDAPTTGQDAQSIEVTWSVQNNGPDAFSAAWTDIVYVAPGGDMNRAIEVARFRRDEGLGLGRVYQRTELVTLPSRIQGLYRVFVRTDGFNEVAEPNESNNLLGAGNFTTVSLHPRADLQVTSVSAPNRIDGGGVIDVDWIVRNFGSAATPTGGSRWTDSVYLSFNRTLDGGDRLLGSLANGSALEIGEGYSSHSAFRLPDGVGGDLFLLVVADAGGNVDESPYESNNVLATPITVDVATVPPPDLVVSNVVGPTDAFDGDTISVRYQVTNRGAGVTYPGSWTDSIWLTLGKDRPDGRRGDIQLGSVGHSGALNIGDSYTNEVSLTLPAHYPFRGQYYLTVWTDPSDSVYEQAFDINLNPDAPNDFDGNNFKASEPINVFYKPPADLEVMSVRGPNPANAEAGTQITVEWQVANNGVSPTNVDRWADAIYVSTDPVLHDGHGQEWRVFGVPHFGKLQSGQRYSQSATFTLPISAEGRYVIVETNVPAGNIVGDDSMFAEQLGQQIAGITSRAEEKLGKSLTQAGASDISRLSRGDVNYILFGDQTGGEPQQVWEGPFTTNNFKATALDVTNHSPDLIVTNVQTAVSAFSGEKIDVTFT